MAHVEGCECSSCLFKVAEEALRRLGESLMRERRERYENNSYGMMRTTEEHEFNQTRSDRPVCRHCGADMSKKRTDSCPRRDLGVDHGR